LGVDGDTHLGGEDFDQNIMTYCALEFQKEHGIDLMDGKDSTNDVTKQEVRRRLKRLQLECERRKIELASCRSVDICVDGIHNEGGVSTDLKGLYLQILFIIIISSPTKG
jgi:molecular chaperone DnaK (HSP70)